MKLSKKLILTALGTALLPLVLVMTDPDKILKAAEMSFKIATQGERALN